MAETSVSHQHHVPTGAVQVKQFEHLRTLLKNAKSHHGKDLFGHLQEVFRKLILHYPDQALEKLEEVSYLTKMHGQGGIKIEDFVVLEESKNWRALTDALSDYIDKLEKFFKVSSSYHSHCSSSHLF